MSTQISFSLHFSADASANDLLLKHLSAGFSSFLCPKMGRIKADGMLLEFGPRPFGKLYEQNTLLEGEEVVAPDITALSQYPNATDEIVQFLTRLLGPTRFNAELVGDCRIDYPDGTNVVEGWLFRYGDDSWRRPIVWLRAQDFGPFSILSGTEIILNVPQPWFFLREWLPEGQVCYSTRETAERNWNRLIDFVQLPIDIAGADKLEELYLNLEGSGPYTESKWLIEYAQRLPKLTVHYA